MKQEFSNLSPLVRTFPGIYSERSRSNKFPKRVRTSRVTRFRRKIDVFRSSPELFGNEFPAPARNYEITKLRVIKLLFRCENCVSFGKIKRRNLSNSFTLIIPRWTLSFDRTRSSERLKVDRSRDIWIFTPRQGNSRWKTRKISPDNGAFLSVELLNRTFPLNGDKNEAGKFRWFKNWNWNVVEKFGKIFFEPNLTWTQFPGKTRDEEFQVSLSLSLSLVFKYVESTNEKFWNSNEIIQFVTTNTFLFDDEIQRETCE